MKEEKPEAYVLKDTTQINRFYDWGCYNDITEGYLIATLQEMGLEKRKIAEAALILEKKFDSIDAEKARQIKDDFWS